MSKISGQFLISGHLWNFRNFRTTGSPEVAYELSVDIKIDDFGWPWIAISSNLQRILQISEATTAKRMKIDPYCQRHRWNPLNVLFNIVFLALICRTFLCQGPSYTHSCRAITLALARLSCIENWWNCCCKMSVEYSLNYLAQF